MRGMNTKERLQYATCENSRAPHKFVLNAGVPQMAVAEMVQKAMATSRWQRKLSRRGREKGRTMTLIVQKNQRIDMGGVDNNIPGIDGNDN